MARNSTVYDFYSQPSSVSEDRPNDFSKDHNRAIIEDIIKDIFDKKYGKVQISSSYSSSVRSQDSVYPTDNRLKYWMSVLNDRKKLTKNLRAKIDKTSGQMLYNYQTTVDELNKSTIKRIFDYTNRLDPKKNQLVLPQKCQCFEEECKQIRSIEDYLPKEEIDGQTAVEIIGLPNLTKTEILGEPKHRTKEPQSNFLKSKTLAYEINRKKSKIDRVLEYYPDIDNLQVVGQNLTHKHNDILKHDSDIQTLSDLRITEISSDDKECIDITTKISSKIQFPEICLLLNGISFQNIPFQRDLRFKCEPYNFFVKHIFHLKNSGTKTLTFSWIKESYYDKVPELLKSKDDEFFFDKRTFRLVPGEENNIVVKYQPRCIGITKQRWNLKIKPYFSCYQKSLIQISFVGTCKPCPEYVAKLQKMKQPVLDKSKWLLFRKMTKSLAELTPLIKPPEVICPYKRELDERELFDAQNKGYKCERYHDLHLLKEIYNRLKMPREPVWDLKVTTLKRKILAIESSEGRALIFSEMMGILDSMKGAPTTWEEKLFENSEKDRAKLIYVRGVISTAIDDWDQIAFALEDSFLHTAIREYLEELFEEEEEAEGEIDLQKIIKNQDEIRAEIWNYMRYNKSFRDALYIDTFTHLCNVVEDIVSVIESTEIL